MHPTQMSRSMKIPRVKSESKAKHCEEKYGVRRVGASPNNKIFCVRGMDIFLNNTKGKSTASILFQNLV